MTSFHGRIDEKGAGARTAGAAGPEGGFALLAVILALVGLTALATTGFYLSSSDNRVSRNHEASVDAFFVAQAGLNQYVGENSRGDLTRVYLYGSDSATVTGRALVDLAASGQTVYRVTSVGVHRTGDGSRAVRTVSTTVLRVPSAIKANAAFTAGGGLVVKNGVSGTISGNDATPGCGQGSKAGIAIPSDGTYDQNGASKLVPQGDPAVDQSRSASELYQSMNMNWDQMLSSGSSYGAPPDTSFYGSVSASQDWPVVTVRDNATVDASMSGKGILIVEGNLTMNGAFQWDGIILTGGYLTSDGQQTINGTLITGMNELAGRGNVPSSDVLNGNKVFQYNSCNVTQALSAFATLSEEPGSWSETL